VSDFGRTPAAEVGHTGRTRAGVRGRVGHAGHQAGVRLQWDRPDTRLVSDFESDSGACVDVG